MSKGRFDAPKTGRQSVKGNNPYAVKNKPQTRGGTYSAKQSGGAAGKSVAAKLWPSWPLWRESPCWRWACSCF